MMHYYELVGKIMGEHMTDIRQIQQQSVSNDTLGKYQI